MLSRVEEAEGAVPRGGEALGDDFEFVDSDDVAENWGWIRKERVKRELFRMCVTHWIKLTNKLYKRAAQ